MVAFLKNIHILYTTKIIHQSRLIKFTDIYELLICLYKFPLCCILTLTCLQFSICYKTINWEKFYPTTKASCHDSVHISITQRHIKQITLLSFPHCPDNGLKTIII